MTDEQLYAKDWLNRCYHLANKIDTEIRNREGIIESMSGIGKYDDKFIPTRDGTNGNETKMLDYSDLSAQIETDIKKLIAEDNLTRRTIEAISGKDADLFKAILIDRYLNRLPWEQICKNQKYERSRLFELHNIALARVYELCPKEVITDD